MIIKLIETIIKELICNNCGVFSEWQNGRCPYCGCREGHNDE